MKIRSNRCLLCQRELEPFGNGLQKHPDADDCEVLYTDAWGIAVDVEIVEVEEPPVESNEPIFIQTFPYVDEVLRDIFAEHGLGYLGGQSSGRGWSSISTFQRCPYLWKRRYLDNAQPIIAVESPSLAVGTLIHVFLALHYAAMVPDHPHAVLTPEMVKDRALVRANPAFVQEAWRVFISYRLYYKGEIITPLAIEYDLRDPRTGESCRYDLIAYIDRQLHGITPGTYIVEHKSSDRFDNNFLEGWPNDGEVIGQVALWQKLGLDKRFGPLKGTIMNLLGKQKVPRYHRTYVSPDSWRVRSHLQDLQRWEGLINLAKSSDTFQRARANCINRYGRCTWYEHCASEDFA